MHARAHNGHMYTVDTVDMCVQWTHVHNGHMRTVRTVDTCAQCVQCLRMVTGFTIALNVLTHAGEPVSDVLDDDVAWRHVIR